MRENERERKARREISRDEGGAKIHDARGEIDRDKKYDRKEKTIYGC